MKIPYGIADFYHVITDGYLYVDRTAHIRQLEALGEALLFIRPRRFGKSLWLHTLKSYYDLRRAEEHERLFGHLEIGSDPTPLAHRYFVLVWNFSEVAARGRVEDISERLGEYVNHTVQSFTRYYREQLPEPVTIEKNPLITLGNLLSVISQTPYRLYLLVDEYDNFANEVMMSDQETYHRLVHAEGPFKQLFKWVKSAMEGQGLERLFITGVSPVVLSDITSGLNICRNVYLDAELNGLCGFTESEVEELLERVSRERPGGLDASISVSGALDMMRTWYNGYRFAVGADGYVYNPTLALYFLMHLLRTGGYPEQILDTNLAADEDKLRYLGQIVSGRQVIVDVLQSGEPLEIPKLEERFTLAAMLEPSGQDQTFLASFLYYFGMLTLVGRTPHRTLLLSPPNLATQTLYLERLRRWLLPLGADRSAAQRPAWALMREGRIDPLLELLENKIFPTFSNRDYRWMNELAVKAALLALLFDDVSYTIYSEPEIRRSHADLCLLLRPDARGADLFDLLLELKYVPIDKLSLSAEQLRGQPREELLSLPAVEAALTAAEAQLERYGQALADKTLRDIATANVLRGGDRFRAPRRPRAAGCGLGDDPHSRLRSPAAGSTR